MRLCGNAAERTGDTVLVIINATSNSYTVDTQIIRLLLLLVEALYCLSIIHVSDVVGESEVECPLLIYELNIFGKDAILPQALQGKEELLLSNR